MVGLAIITGFFYENSLPACLIDMYRVYVYSISLKLTPIIITDIEQDPKMDEIYKAFDKGEVDAGVINFISSMKSRGLYYLVSPHRSHADPKGNAYEVMLDIFSSIFKSYQDVDKILYYYTGHGKKTLRKNCSESQCFSPTISGNPPTASDDQSIYNNKCVREAGILLPNNKIFSYDKIFKVLHSPYDREEDRSREDHVINEKGSPPGKSQPSESSRSSGNNSVEIEIAMIIDCCECTLSLPFKIIGDRFRLIDGENIKYKYPTLLLSASLGNEPAYMSSIGSLFTKRLLRYLDKRHLPYIETKMSRHDITLHTYCNYPLQPYIWQWLVPGHIIDVGVSGDLFIINR